MTTHAREITAAPVDATSFIPRHIGPSPAEIRAMLDLLGYASLDSHRRDGSRASVNRPLAIHAPMSEHGAHSPRGTARHNQIARSYIGLGYYDCVTPPVIQRNVLRIPAGTRLHPIKPRSRRDVSRRC
jgi:glycine dehydrogenase